MKNKTSNKVNYTRSKDAYDGNMEITNLKSSSQKVSVSVEPTPEKPTDRGTVK